MRPAEVTFRLRGWGRAGLAIFLLIWLAGWAVGEWFALRVLVWGLFDREAPQFITNPVGCVVAGFIVVWFLIWTLAGAGAAIELGRLVAGHDTLTIGSQGVAVRRAIGPFALTKRFATEEVRDVFVTRGGGSLMLDTTRGDILVTTFGTREERRAIEREYSRRDEALSELPHGWTTEDLPDGRFRIVDRRRRREWLVRRDEVILVTRSPFGSRRRFVDNGSLHVDRSVDSDGDETFFLEGTSNGKSVTLLREVRDERTVVRLARLIERTSGWSVRTDYYD